jgi:hypothetical protein
MGKWTLKKYDESVWTDLFGSELGPVAGSCGHDNDRKILGNHSSGHGY